MVSVRSKVFMLICTLTVMEIEGARVLVYIPTPSISHQVVFRPFTQELAARGHEVVVVTTDPVFPKGKSPANLTEIDVHDVSYEEWKDMLIHSTGNKQAIKLQVLLLLEKFARIVDHQLQTPGVKEILNKDKNYFDILLIESCNRLLLGFAHKFSAPVILVSSFGAVASQYGILGAPMHPLLYPTAGRQRLYNLSLFEKGIELLKQIALDYLIWTTEDFDMKIMKKNFGEEVPSFKELSKRISMLFLNEHRIWADNHPVPPSIIYMGGIHQTIEKNLTMELKNYLDSSRHGVIYVSFGTNVLPSLLPPEKIQIMTKVFSELPYDVLWKYDKDTLPGKPKNVKISKWFPQVDLLKHPNVKLFITQGGLQSTDEVINAGVPVIGIPMLLDQWYNVEKYVHHKVGLQLDITTLNEINFKESIQKVIQDKSFKDNMVRLRNLMREYPVKPLELAVWWTEHVIKYGGSHLQSPAAHTTWIEYYEVKLVLIILCILVSILVILGLILKLVLKLAYKTFKMNIKVKKS